MMPRSIAVILAVFLPAYAATAIDFTPHYMMEDADGIVVKRPYFTDGTVKYGIKFFADAVLTGQENAAIFKYSAFTYATMIWRSSPLTPRPICRPMRLWRSNSCHKGARKSKWKPRRITYFPSTTGYATGTPSVTSS